MPRAKLAMFWDYDTQWGADRSRLPGGPKDWGALESPCTERLLELHAEYDVPACFAVVGAASMPGPQPYHDRDQIRRIHAAGHEVASHSHRHEWIPALTRTALMETLRTSKSALEDCIGAAVQAFVPPYNQPFDYPRRLSVSLSERKEAGRSRTGLRQLCDALAETGYTFCRVAYRPITHRLNEWWQGRRIDYPSGIERIGDVSCVRLNTSGGFDAPVLAMLDRCVEVGGIVIAYGHPHSLHSGNSQDERHLVPFLKRVAKHRRDGQLEVVLPRRLPCR